MLPRGYGALMPVEPLSNEQVPVGNSSATPALSRDTVFFVGNGVLRVAPLAGEDIAGPQDLSPSWAEYMDNLWSFIKIPSESPDFLALEEFSRLPAPRQAEWFDRELRNRTPTTVDVAALRLHLLGKSCTAMTVS
jgi:hypothetical protein